MILRDDHSIRVPTYTQMFIGDSKKQADYNRSKLLESLGPRIKILTTIDTSRSGSVVNGRVYPAKDVRAGMSTWTTPYRRPFLKQHPSQNMFTSADEPLVQGRVVGGKFVPLKDDLNNDWINPPVRDEGSGMVLNTVEISDRDAVEAIIDGRTLTVSVGMIPGKMLCPFCLADWKASMDATSAPPEKCEHRPGNVYDASFQTYKGKMPFYFVTRGITFDHIAATYRPAQPYAAILGWEALADSLALPLGGEALIGDLSSLALCDEAGHIVRLGAPVDEDRAAPPLNETEAVVLAFMDAAGVLDLSADAEDGFDAADITAAISRVTADGTFQRYKADNKGKVYGTNGALPVGMPELAEASTKMIGRYTGRNRDLMILKLLDAKSKQNAEAKPASIPEVTTMTWEEIEALSDSILDKIKDLPEDAEMCEDVLKKVLPADLYEQVKFDGIKQDPAEEADRELEGVAGGLIVADAKLSAASRDKLPDSAFCGPDRSFPAHDESHVRNGLSQLPKAKLSSSQKARVRACLVRKGKKYGIKANKEGDSQMEKELQEKLQVVEKSLADAQAQNVVLTRELEEVKKVLADANAKIEAANKVAHDSLVKEVFDLRKKLSKPDTAALADDEKVKAYIETLSKRSDDSLRDSLSDLKLESESGKIEPPAAQVPDPVLKPASQPGTETKDKDKEPAKPLSNKEKAAKLLRTKK